MYHADLLRSCTAAALIALVLEHTLPYARTDACAAIYSVQCRFPDESNAANNWPGSNNARIWSQIGEAPRKRTQSSQRERENGMTWDHKKMSKFTRGGQPWMGEQMLASDSPCSWQKCFHSDWSTTTVCSMLIIKKYVNYCTTTFQYRSFFWQLPLRRFMKKCLKLEWGYPTLHGIST